MADANVGKFSKLWEGFAEKLAGKNKGVTVNLPADKLADVAKKLSFTGAISREQLEQVAKGGDDAVNALLDIVNSAGQQGFQQSIAASGRMVEQALAEQRQQFQAMLPEMVKEVQSGASVSKALPGLSDAAFAPLAETVRAGILANNPGATADEIAAETQAYFSSLAEAVSPKAQTETDVAKDMSASWDNFLGLPPPKAAAAA